MVDFTTRPNPDVYTTVSSFNVGSVTLEVWERAENGHRIWVLTAAGEHTGIHPEMAAKILMEDVE